MSIKMTAEEVIRTIRESISRLEVCSMLIQNEGIKNNNEIK